LFIIIITTTLGDHTHGLVVVLVFLVVLSAPLEIYNRHCCCLISSIVVVVTVADATLMLRLRQLPRYCCSLAVAAVAGALVVLVRWFDAVAVANAVADAAVAIAVADSVAVADADAVADVAVAVADAVAVALMQLQMRRLLLQIPIHLLLLLQMLIHLLS
jgi:hypothetical protein